MLLMKWLNSAFVPKKGKTEFADIGCVRQEESRMLHREDDLFHGQGPSQGVKGIWFWCSPLFISCFQLPTWETPVRWLWHTVGRGCLSHATRNPEAGPPRFAPELTNVIQDLDPFIFLLSHLWQMTFLLIQDDSCTSRHQVHIPGRKTEK